MQSRFKNIIIDGKRLIDLKSDKVLTEDVASVSVENKRISDKNKKLVKEIERGVSPEEMKMLKDELYDNNTGLINDFVKDRFKENLGISRQEFKSGVEIEFLDKLIPQFLRRGEKYKDYDLGAYARMALYGGKGFGGGRIGNILKSLGQNEKGFTQEYQENVNVLESYLANPAPKPGKIDTKREIDLAKKLGIEKEVNELLGEDFQIDMSLEGQSYKTLKTDKLETLLEKSLTKQKLLDVTTAKAIYNAAFAKGVTMEGKSTGVANLIKEAFYVKSDTRVDAKLGKSKAGLAAQVKQPFSYPKWKEFVNDLYTRRVVDGKPERLNDQFNKRAPAFRAEVAKLLANQFTRLKTPLAESSIYNDIVKDIADGKSDMAAKIILEEQKLGEVDYNVLEARFQEIFKNQGIKKSPAQVRKLIESYVDSKKFNVENGKEIYEQYKKDQLLKKDFTEKELEILNEISEKDYKASFPEYSKLVGEKLEYLTEAQMGSPEHIAKKRAADLRYIQQFPPFNTLSKSMQNTIMKEIGFGSFKIEFNGEKFIMGKEGQNNLDVLASYFGGTQFLKGKGKTKKWMDEFFIPSDFGYGRTPTGTATGFKSKIEDFIEARKPGTSEIKFNESLAKYARTILTKPGSKNMGSVSAYEKTTKANKEYIKSNLKNLYKIINKAKTPEGLKTATEGVVNLLRLQTNIAGGGFKGAVPYSSVLTSVPVKEFFINKKGKRQMVKRSHNEHDLQLRNMSDKFIKMALRNRNNPKQFTKELDVLINDLSQSLIPEPLRVFNDARGNTSINSSVPLLNTLSQKGAGINQVNLYSGKGENMAQKIYQEINHTKLKEILKDVPFKDKSAGIIELEQMLNNPKEYAKVSSNNNVISKKPELKDLKNKT
ncbi:MAG: hypothetical protein H8E16_22105, partial [Flavobacteriales bacterium]|nr:hypothetical protein [Flavobacteriales bacterium]